MVVEFFLFFLGALLAIWWFSVTVHPLGYGLPKALYWCYRGLFSWRILANFVVPPALWNFAFVGAAVVLVVWFPSVASRLRASITCAVGQWLALLGSLIYVFTREGRASLREDFLDTAMHYVVTKDPVLLGEFGYRNPIRDLLKNQDSQV
jgi:hypothetical protein